MEAEIFAEVLAEGRRQGVFHFVDAVATAALLLMATNSLLPYSLSTRELGKRTEIDQRISGLDPDVATDYPLVVNLPS